MQWRISYERYRNNVRLTGEEKRKRMEKYPKTVESGKRMNENINESYKETSNEYGNNEK